MQLRTWTTPAGPGPLPDGTPVFLAHRSLAFTKTGLVMDMPMSLRFVELLPGTGSGYFGTPLACMHCAYLSNWASSGPFGIGWPSRSALEAAAR